MNSAKTMVNVSPKMSNRDAIERELEKFVKMFSTKAVQAIVQSRLGDKMQTFSNPRSLSNDWVSELENQVKTKKSKTNEKRNEFLATLGCFVIIGISTPRLPPISQLSIKQCSVFVVVVWRISIVIVLLNCC